RVQGALGLLVAVVVVEALGRHEHLAALKAGSVDRLTYLRLVAVGGGGVGVAITGRQRLRDHLLGLAWWDLEDAEAELRDRVGVAKRDLWDLTVGCAHGLVP